MDELLPCPFCGGEAKDIHGYTMSEEETEFIIPFYKVFCKKCQNRTSEFYDLEEAIAAWNRRAEPENKPLTCDGCEYIDEYENEVEYGYPSPCTACQRRAVDNYRHKLGEVEP